MISLFTDKQKTLGVNMLNDSCFGYRSTWLVFVVVAGVFLRVLVMRLQPTAACFRLFWLPSLMPVAVSCC